MSDKTDLTDNQALAAWQAWRDYCERFILCGVTQAGNDPWQVVDGETGETVYGPATDAMQWNGIQGMKAAIGAALKTLGRE